MSENFIDKALPTNLKAEQLLLGVILLNNEVLHRVEEFLKSEHFSHPVHIKIYSAMQKVFDKSLPISSATLEGMLHIDSDFIANGKSQYLNAITSMAIGVTDPYGYAKIIYDLALKRTLIGIATGIIHTSYNSSIVEDANEQIAQIEDKLFNLTEQGSTERNFIPLSKIVKISVEDVNNARRSPKNITGIASGLIDLDKKLSGFHNSDLVIIAGRPSMGKTALAVNIALNIAISDDVEVPQRSVGFFSLEMSSEQLALRMLSIQSSINAMNLKSGSIKEEQYNIFRKKADVLSDAKFFIDDTPALSIAAIRSRARRLKRRHNVDILFVDYLQLIRSNNNYDNRVLEISEITQGLKALAKELNVPVIALSQLSRAVEQRPDKHPMLSDLRDSGTIEQDSDIVMFIYREEYYLSRSVPELGSKEYEQWQNKMNSVCNLAEVIIAKHRNGPIGNVGLFYDNNLAKFANADKRLMSS
jgi:replicative DNA helicase